MVGSWTGEAIYGLWPFKLFVFRSTSLMPEQIRDDNKNEFFAK